MSHFHNEDDRLVLALEELGGEVIEGDPELVRLGVALEAGELSWAEYVGEVERLRSQAPEPLIPAAAIAGLGAHHGPHEREELAEGAEPAAEDLDWSAENDPETVAGS